MEESSNAIRLELDKLKEAGIIEASTSSNKKIFRVNKKHKLISMET
jgi:predicted transcriptional regulator